MVKKISGSTPTRPTEGTGGVKSTGAVETAKVGGVTQVSGVNAKTGVDRARRATRPMTAEERAHLMALVDEEADKLFGEQGITDSRRAVVTNSVKITLSAGLLSDEEDDEKKS